jgi:hypothetical protein
VFAAAAIVPAAGPALTPAADRTRAMVAAVRRDSATYPRPTPLASFMDAPFAFSAEEIDAAVARLLSDPACEDVRPLTASDGSRFLYSSRSRI